MVIECPALQCVQDKYAALFAHGACTMQSSCGRWMSLVLHSSSSHQGLPCHVGCAGVINSYIHHLVNPRWLEEVISFPSSHAGGPRHMYSS